MRILEIAREQVLDRGVGLDEAQTLEVLQLPDEAVDDALALAHEVRMRWCGPAVEVVDPLTQPPLGRRFVTRDGIPVEVEPVVAVVDALDVGRMRAPRLDDHGIHNAHPIAFSSHVSRTRRSQASRAFGFIASVAPNSPASSAMRGRLSSRWPASLWRIANGFNGKSRRSASLAADITGAISVAAFICVSP